MNSGCPVFPAGFVVRSTLTCKCTSTYMCLSVPCKWYFAKETSVRWWNDDTIFGKMSSSLAWGNGSPPSCPIHSIYTGKMATWLLTQSNVQSWQTQLQNLSGPDQSFLFNHSGWSGAVLPCHLNLNFPYFYFLYLIRDKVHEFREQKYYRTGPTVVQW